MGMQAVGCAVWFGLAVSALHPHTVAAEVCPQPFLRPDVQNAAAGIVQKMLGMNSRWTAASMKLFMSNGLANTRFAGLDRNDVYRITGGERGNDNLALCFPTFKAVLTRVEQGERLESERRVAEQQRIEAERNKPAHVLLQSYSQYVYLKKCELERHGYLSVNLSELELDRAKTAVRNIEKKMTETDPALDKDSLWQAANTANNSVAETDRDRCQLTLRLLEETYRTLFPEAKTIRKDF